MCEHCPEPTPDAVSRRHLLGRAAHLPLLALGASAASTAFAVAADATAVERPPIVPRSEWGGDLRPRGAIPAEDVKFLLVHHTAEPGSDYGPSDAVGLLRSIYQFHTGASKGWPDLAYNFFVDLYGNVYEGRWGSLDGPVRGSATGGNQGYSQLCCFLGNFDQEVPPAPALESMYLLLAWLADRYGVDTSPGVTVEVTSLGSNRWPAGSTIVTPTIAAHRDMSLTECPGDACYALVRGQFAAQVTARRAPAQVAPEPTETTSTTTTATAAAPSTQVTDTSVAVTSAPTTEPEEVARAASSRLPSTTPWWPLAAVGAASAVALAAALRRRGGRSEVDADPVAAAAASDVRIAWREWRDRPDPDLGEQIRSFVPELTGGDRWWDEPAPAWQDLLAAVQRRPWEGDHEGTLVVAAGRGRAIVLLSGAASGRIEREGARTAELPRDAVSKVELERNRLVLELGGRVVALDEQGRSTELDDPVSG